jgi:hypothetical protein
MANMMTQFEHAVPVCELTRSPEDAFRQGLAVVDLQMYDATARSLASEAGRFAQYIDGSQEPEVDASPRRLVVPEHDAAQMELYGRKFARIVMPLTGVSVGRLIRARFLVYTEAGATTGDHIDDPLDDDHVVSLGVNLTGRGVLRSMTYSRPGNNLLAGRVVSERTPIQLEPGVAVVQQGQTMVSHNATSCDAYRVVGVWDFAA